MIQCKCGSTVFKSQMVASSNVLVSSKSGRPELLPGSEETRDIDFKGTFVCEMCGEVYLDICDTDESDGDIRRCTCGNTRFTAHQICRHDVIVDSNNNFDRDDGIYDSETPYGPYMCTQCNAEYGELEELPVVQASADSSLPPVFEPYRITQNPKHSLYLSWAELTGLTSSLISDILGRKVLAEATLDDFYYMYLSLKEPITSAEMDALYETALAGDDDWEEKTEEYDEPIEIIEQSVSQKLIGKLLPFDLDLARADKSGVWFIGDSR